MHMMDVEEQRNMLQREFNQAIEEGDLHGFWVHHRKGANSQNEDMSDKDVFA